MPVSILASIVQTITPYDEAGNLLPLSQIILDALTSESAVYDGQVTEFPIEDGSSVSDHIYNSPEQYRISGIVSNASILEVGKQSATFGNENRANAVNNILREIQRNKILVKIVSGLKVFENMAIESYTVSRNRPIDGIEVSLALKNIVKVNAQTVQPVVNTTTQLNQTDLGKRQAQDASATEAGNVSRLRQLYNQTAVGG